MSETRVHATIDTDRDVVYRYEKDAEGQFILYIGPTDEEPIGMPMGPEISVGFERRRESYIPVRHGSPGWVETWYQEYRHALIPGERPGVVTTSRWSAEDLNRLINDPNYFEQALNNIGIRLP